MRVNIENACINVEGDTINGEVEEADDGVVSL